MTSSDPSVVTSMNNVYVVWHDNSLGSTLEILYIMSTDGGGTFGSTVNLSNNAGGSALPSIAVSGNNVHVVWQDSTFGNSEILYRSSTDGGVNFGSTVNLSNNAGFSVNPSIAASGNNVYVVWRDEVSANAEIFYRSSTDSGISFGSTVNLSNNVGFSDMPAIAAAENNVYLVWADGIAAVVNDIIYRTSTDGGTTFEPESSNLSTNTGDSIKPSIAAS
jgi:hypothetical protein